MNPFVKVLYEIVYLGLERFGRYYSIYPGFVYDNKDPKNMHRLRLVIPGIADTPMDEWAWPHGLFSGETFGAHCIPPEGSTVWVSFRLGDPNYPIWEHGHFGKQDTVTWTDSQKRYNNFWFKTPQGNTIELDDELGTITITDAHGNIAKTSDKGVSMIPAKGKKLFMGSEDKGDEASAMGDTTQKIAKIQHAAIKGAISNIDALSEQIKGLGEKWAVAFNPVAAAGILIAQGPLLVKQNLEVQKNNKTLNKSLTDVDKDLDKITSKKVFLDR